MKYDLFVVWSKEKSNKVKLIEVDLDCLILAYAD